MKFKSLIFFLCVSITAAYASTYYSSNILKSYLQNFKIKNSLKQDLEPKLEKDKNDGATISVSTFNLAKSVIGAGVLSLPSGVAAFSNDPRALLPSSILCLIFGLFSAYSFQSIGKVCNDQGAKSFKDAWTKCVNKKSSWLISASINSLCFLACLTFSIIIGDSFSALFKTLNFPQIMSQRSNAILLLSSSVLLPLCSLKNLSSLAPFSILGLVGTLYTGLFMAIRYFDKSYFEGGRFFGDVKHLLQKPSFKFESGYSLNPLSLILVSMLSTSFIAHYNAPKFFTELKNPTTKRFNRVVYTAFSAAITFFIFIMSIGFLTFGGNSQGFILNNYSGSDPLASIARFSIAVALVTGYPFAFSALKDGVLDILNIDQERRDALSPYVTMTCLSIITFLALVLKDVGIVVSISGAIFGSLLMFIVPGILNISNIRINSSGNEKPLSTLNTAEIYFNYFLILLGVSMGGLGVSISILKEIGKL